MRRILATIALLMFGWTTFEPASLALLVSSNVPLCCRKGGKHHCTGSPSDDAADGIVHLHAVTTCPHRTPAIAPSAHFQFETPSDFKHQPLAIQSAVTPREALGQVSASSTLRFDRGPPQSPFLIPS